VISYALYLAGVLLLRNRLSEEGGERGLGLLLSLSFVPFVFETWIGGQVSVLSFAAYSLAFFLSGRGHHGWAGLALGLCAFRPPILAVTGLMLLVGRRWRMAAGLAASAAALYLAAGAYSGIKVYEGWFLAMDFFRWVATGNHELFRVHKYVDWNAFFRPLFGAGSTLAAVLAGAATVVGLLALGWAWLRANTLPRASQDLVWSATLIATLLCNVYAPVYDCLLVVVAVHLAAGPARELGPSVQAQLARWLVPLYMVPWFTQSIAEVARLQLLTLVLAGFGAWALRTALGAAAATAGASGSVSGATGAASVPPPSAEAAEAA
jgi:hypothetical protein